MAIGQTIRKIISIIKKPSQNKPSDTFKGGSPLSGGKYVGQTTPSGSVTNVSNNPLPAMSSNNPQQNEQSRRYYFGGGGGSSGGGGSGGSSSSPLNADAILSPKPYNPIASLISRNYYLSTHSSITPLSSYHNTLTGGSSYGAYKPFTNQEQSNINFYNQVYGNNPFYLKEKTLSGLELQKIRNEAFGTTQKPFLKSGAGTQITQQTPYEELSNNAKFYRETLKESVTSDFVLKNKLEAKKEELISNLNKKENLSQEDIDKVNRELTSYSQSQSANSQEKLNQKNKELMKNIYEIKEDKIKFDPYKAERKLYDFGINPVIIRPSVATASFGVGAINAVLNNPSKIGENILLGAGLTIATGGIGTLVVEGGLIGANVVKNIGTAINIGAGTLYAGSSALQVISKGGGVYDLAKNTGEIVATDLTPFLTGAKVGSYGVRRFNIARELKSQTEALPEPNKALFKSELIEAKKLQDIEPNVKDLSLAGMERIPKQAEEIILKFFEGKKNKVIIGGSVAQRTQLYVPEAKVPSDIDVYVKGFFQDFFSKRYSQELYNLLQQSGIKRVSQSATSLNKITIGGEKAVEFLPYNKYLRANLESVVPFYRTAKYGLTKTPKEINVQKLSFQLQRKLIGGYLDPSRASKDLPSAEIIKESLIKTQLLQSKANELQKYPLPLSFGVIDFELPLNKDLNINNLLEKGRSRVKSVSGGGEGIYKEYSYPSISKIISYDYLPRNEKQAPTFYKPKQVDYSPKKPYKSFSNNVTSPTNYSPNLISQTYLPKQDLPYAPKSFYPSSSSKINIKRTIYPQIPELKEKKIKYSFNRKQRRNRQTRKAYTGYIKRRGQIINVFSGLPQGRALKSLSDNLLRDLARTGRIVESGETSMQDINYIPNSKTFRNYRVKQGRKVGLPFGKFIQRTTKSFTTDIEKQLIKEARRISTRKRKKR